MDRLRKPIGWLGARAENFLALILGALFVSFLIQIVFRYLLNQNFPKLDEIQWHFYGLVTMVGISYALVTDSHVRVDILHLQLSRRAQRIIEVLGILTLVAPFLYLMVDQGWDYFYESWRVSERSSSPTGLPGRWAFKAIIPISFILLSCAALARLIHDVHALFVAGSEERQGKDLRLILWALVSFAVVAFALTFLVESTDEKLVIAMFLTFIALLFTGFPVRYVDQWRPKNSSGL